MSKVLNVEVKFPYPDERDMEKENYVVSFEGEIAVGQKPERKPKIRDMTYYPI